MVSNGNTLHGRACLLLMAFVALISRINFGRCSGLLACFVRKRIASQFIVAVLTVAFCFLSAGLCFGQPREGKSALPAGETKIAEFKSANFILRTDLNPEEAKELLVRLETMLGLISRYWGRKNPRVIEMYVVKELSNWPAGLLHPQGRASIARGGGLTIAQKRTLGQRWESKAVVYAVADRGTPQHEAVHAYCSHAFGGTGPTWYSEGMAEIGQYWKDIDDKSVQCSAEVLRYLKTSEPKPLKEVVDLAQFTGDSWQNYAWRWSICHLLGFNDNYSQRFKPLGLALMTQQRQVSFWTVYGTMSQEIEFEYLLFLKNMAIGYRVDLCSWDWKTKFKRISGRRTAISKIKANRGWQATRLIVKSGEKYLFETTGKWKIEAEGEELTAQGNEQSKGNLVGVLFDNYQLSEPFDLGASSTYTASGDGKLYVRCNDDWASLADNEGTLSLKIKRLP